MASDTGVMDMDAIINRLGSIKTYGLTLEDLDAEVDACSEAINILYALLDCGAHTVKDVKNIICDYNKLSKQYQAMYKQHGTAGKAIHKDGVWHCPGCNRRVTPGHSFCHWCAGCRQR